MYIKNYNYKNSMDSEYIFSIIIFNNYSQQDLKLSLNSLINQTIDFKKNIQVIIINSQKNHEHSEILKEYKRLYPDNFSILTLKNEKRYPYNLALKHIKGKYVNFMPVGDYIDKEILNQIYDFMQKNRRINIVTVPAYSYNKEKSNNVIDNIKDDCILDLNKNPNYILLTLYSSYINSDIIKNYQFNDILTNKNDSLFLNQILINNSKIGVLKSSKYYHKTKEDEEQSYNLEEQKSSLFNLINEYYLKILKFSKNQVGFIPVFLQYDILYQLKDIIIKENIECLTNKKEKKIFLNSIKKILKNISKDVIFNNGFIERTSVKYFLYYLKIGKQSYTLNDNHDVIIKLGDFVIDDIGTHNFWLSDVFYDEDNVILKGFFSSYFCADDLSITAENTSGESFFAEFDKSSMVYEKYMGIIWHSKFNFKIKIPYQKIDDFTLNVNYHINHDNHDFSSKNVISSAIDIKYTKNCKFSRKNYIEIDDNTFLSFYENHFNLLKYKFSVVMAVYNTEDYLEEAIKSVINQSIGFENNVQLIIVNDGSKDSSLDIAKRYQKNYPENIVVLSQENSGQSTARNNGIQYANGLFVNFLDSDDFLKEDAMEKVYEFFEEHAAQTDVVSIPMMLFGRVESSHVLNYKFDKTRIINLNKEPNSPLLSASSSFFKRHLFPKYNFPTNVIFSEDAIMINKILLEKKSLGVIKDTVYYYRKRNDFSSTIDTVGNKKEYFTDKLKYYFMELINYSLSKENRVHPFIQFTLMYDLQWLVEQPDISILKTDEEKEEFWHYLHKVINYMEYRTILRNRNIRSQLTKNFLLTLKNNDFRHEIDDENNDVCIKTGKTTLDRFKSHKIWLDIIQIENNNLNISGLYNSYFNTDNITFEAIKIVGKKEEVYYGKNVKYTSRKNVVFLSREWSFKNNFDLTVPLNKNEDCEVRIRLSYHKDANPNNYAKGNIKSAYIKLDFTAHAKLSNISNYFIKDDYNVAFLDNRFFIRKNTYKSFLIKEYKTIKRIYDSKEYAYKYAIFTRFIYLIIYRFFILINRNKKIYLFMDRIEVADDNATHLFRYAVTQKDNIKKYLVLSKDSKDYNKLKKIGKVLKHNSFKHRIYTFFADAIISSHPYESVINPFYSYTNDERKLYSGLITSKIYFLQHGVTLGNISSWMSKYDKNLSLLVTVSDMERESFNKEGYNYDMNIIQTLGFPRYDNLSSNDSKKQILLIPTWRKIYKGKPKKFLKSRYYEQLNNMLSNEKLINLSKKYGYNIVFKGHPELERFDEQIGKRYIDLLKIDENIKVSTTESYQELFNQSKLMITDFSSVFFDFAYLKKCLIYFQPDDDYHYDESYFDFETMGFGDLIHDFDELVDKIEEYLKNDCQMEDKYKDRVDNFFKYTDINNCKRVYDWINTH